MQTSITEKYVQQRRKTDNRVGRGKARLTGKTTLREIKCDLEEKVRLKGKVRQREERYDREEKLRLYTLGDFIRLTWQILIARENR